jgi:colanic acid biosynthesis glycosyl transferase WcaI
MAGSVANTTRHRRVRILLSSIVYRPEPTGYRAHDLAAGLAELGHEVVAITGLPSYPLGRIYEGYQVRPWQWERLDGVRLLRLPYVMSRSRSAVRRVLSYSSFSIQTVVAGLLQRWRPDVMWTNQVGLPGVALKILRRTAVVHEVQDLWPEWTAMADLGIRRWLYDILDRQQTTIYRRAEAITTISEGFRRWLVQRGVTAGKISVIPNWVNSEDFYPAPRDGDLGAREGLVGRFNVVYAGNVGVAQALDAVLLAAERLKDLNDVQFVIIGDGLEKKRLEQEAVDRGLGNVRFLGRRPVETMAGYLAWAGVLLLHLKSDPRYDITIPSKTYSYLACGRPIVAAARGDVAELIETHKAGEVVAPEDAAALARAVREMYGKPVEEREQYGQNALQAFRQHFDRDTLVRRYEALFANVAGPAGPRQG